MKRLLLIPILALQLVCLTSCTTPAASHSVDAIKISDFQFENPYGSNFETSSDLNKISGILSIGLQDIRTINNVSSTDTNLIYLPAGKKDETPKVFTLIIEQEYADDNGFSYHPSLLKEINEKLGLDTDTVNPSVETERIDSGANSFYVQSKLYNKSYKDIEGTIKVVDAGTTSSNMIIVSFTANDMEDYSYLFDKLLGSLQYTEQPEKASVVEE